MEIVQAVYFSLEQSRQIQKFGPNQRKKVNIVIFLSETTRKAKKIEILPRFQKWMKKTNILRVSIIILKTFDTETETGFTESQEAIKDFINQQKSANTNKKTATDINTLFHYMEAYGIKRSIQRYLSYMKYSFNILKDNEFEKSRN